MSAKVLDVLCGGAGAHGIACREIMLRTRAIAPRRADRAQDDSKRVEAGVPDLMEPTGPEPPRAFRRPSWEEWVTSLCLPVRELSEGERPGDWANDTIAGTRAKASR